MEGDRGKKMVQNGPTKNKAGNCVSGKNLVKTEKY